MISAFTCGHKQFLRLTDMSAEALRRAVWIDLLEATPDEIETVQSATGLALPTQDAVSEIETSSRLSSRNGALYLSMPLIAFSEEGPRGVSAGFVLSPERLLTVRFAARRLFDTFVDRQADALEQVSANLDSISTTIFAMGVNQEGGRKQEDATLRNTLGRIGHIGDLISHVRETQVGAGRIVPYVEATAAEWLPKAQAPRLGIPRAGINAIKHLYNQL